MKRKKIAKRAFIIFVSTCILIIAGFFTLNSVIKNRISYQLTHLSPQLQIKFSNIHTRFFSSSVSFDSLAVNFIPYNYRRQNGHHLYFQRAILKGISFSNFVFHKNLTVENLIVHDASIRLDKYLLDQKDSLQSTILKRIEFPFRQLSINNLQLRGVKIFLRSNNEDELLATGDIAIGGIVSGSMNERPTFATVDLRLSNISYPLRGYKFHIQQLAIDSKKKLAVIDSLQISGENHKTTIAAIKISGFNIEDLISRKSLNTEEIVVGTTKIEMGDKARAPLMAVSLKKLYVHTLRCQDAWLFYNTRKAQCSFNLSLDVQNLGIDSFFTVSFGSLWGNLSNIRYANNNYHNVEVAHIELNSEKEIIQLKDLKIIPRLGKYQFGRKLGRQADWVNASISKIVIEKPNFQQLLHQKLIAGKITIGTSRAYIFRDRRLPRSQKLIPLPIAYLKTLPIDIRVPALDVATSAVAYEEYPRQGYGQTGILKIVNIKARMSPLINYPLDSDPAYTTMNVDGSIMGSGNVHGIVLMPLKRNLPYRITGAIEKLELTRLNSSSENLGKIRIKSGFLDFLKFDFTMTDQRSTGKIIGAYHQLIIQQLKKHTEEKNVADFASLMLRHLIIPLNKDKSLPERKRTGLVNYQRDPSRFVSHYFLQSLLMGVKKSFTLGFLLPK